MATPTTAHAVHIGPPCYFDSRSMLVAMAVAYVATLPLLHPVLMTLGFKRVVLADVAFPFLLLTAALGARRWLRRPWLALCVAAAGPPLAILVSGALAGARAVPDLARVLYSLSVLILFAHLRLSPPQIDVIVRGWVITACGVCLAGLGGLLAVTVFGAPENLLASASSANLGPGVIRVGSTLGANALALFLQPSVALCIYLMRQRRDAGHWPGGALASFLTTAVLTFSRGIVGMSLVLSLAVRACRRWLAAATVVLLAAAVSATIWGVFPIHGGRLNTMPNAYRVLHVAAARMFAARPLAGVGPGGFSRRLGEFTTPEERAAAWPPISLAQDHDPHSTWLGRAAESGLLGLMAWAGLYGFIARRLLDSPPGTLPRLAGCALAGLALSGLAVEISHLKFVWCFLGLALSARAAEREATAC
jgi:O-antigen ligase